MIWRRLLVRSDSTITDLHYILQIAFGWSDGHLNRFHIHGQDYGVYHDGGIGFSTDPEHVQLGDFRFRVNPPAPSAPPRAPDVPIHRSNRIRRETVRRNASIRAASVASAERRQRTAAARMPS